MKSLTLDQQLAYSFSLLSNEEDEQVQHQLQKNSFDNKIASMIERSINVSPAITPDKKEFFAELWKKHQNKPISLNWRSLRKPYMSGFQKLSRAASVVLLFGIGILLFFQNPSRPAVMLTLTNGTAVISQDGHSTPLEKTTRLVPGMQLTAESKAGIQGILLDNGKIVFKGPGQFALKQYETRDNKSQLRFTLARGRMQLSLKRKAYRSFIVQTPHALITVHGTVFSIQVSRQRTRVQVKSGKVKVAAVNKASRFRILTSGQTVIIEDNYIRKVAASKRFISKKQLRFRERIQLKSGMIVTGKIISRSNSSLIIQTASGTLTIAKSSIKTIRVIKSR